MTCYRENCFAEFEDVMVQIVHMIFGLDWVMRTFVETANLLDNMKVLNFIVKTLIHISGACGEKTYFPLLQIGTQPLTSCLVNKLR